VTELRVQNLSVELGGRSVLKNVTFESRSGDVIGLIGPNGAGKSTLMKAMLGLIPSTGRVEFSGTTLTELSTRERAQQACYVAQDREIAWPLSVRHVVALGRTPFLTPARGLSTKDEALVDEAMAQVDITHLAHRNVRELSGGERARVLTARAFAQNAPVLIADEPAAGLDPAHQIALLKTIATRVRCRGLALVSIHDLALAARWCTRLLLLHEGRLVAYGDPCSVLNQDMFAQVYGIEVMVSETERGPIMQTIGLIPRKR
jgi:iron complex transport system ATP-binding protein